MSMSIDSLLDDESNFTMFEPPVEAVPLLDTDQTDQTLPPQCDAPINRTDCSELRLLNLSEKLCVDLCSRLCSARMRHLRSLVLGGTDCVSTSSLMALSDLLHRQTQGTVCPSLVSLDLSHCTVGSAIDSASRSFFQALGCNTVVRHVSLQGNQLQARHAPMIAECLSRNTTLRSLDLRNNSLSIRGWWDILDSLQENLTLQTLMAPSQCQGGPSERCAQQLSDKMAHNVRIALKHTSSSAVFNNTIASLQDNVESKQAEIDALREQIDHMQADYRERECRLQAEIKQLQTDNVALHGQNDALQAQIVSLHETHAAQLQAEYSRFNQVSGVAPDRKSVV